MKKVLVTGATGFIGQYLCRSLLKQGVELHVLGRSPVDFQATFHSWNLTQPVDGSALQGVDTVFHLAGKAHELCETSQDADEYFQINTEATRKLLEAARQAGVSTFVYFSSVKACGSHDGAMDESTVVMPDTPYGQSKLAAEELVLEGGYVPNPVVIRPAMVYGNTEKGNLPRMIRAIAAGRFPPLPEVGNRRSMVHVDDIVQAAILAAERPEAAGQVYIVTDGVPYSTRHIYEWICEALGKPVPGWTIPMPVLNLLAKAGDGIGSLRGRRFMFDTDALEKLVGSACFSSGKIERGLGFKAKRHLRESLPEITDFLGRAG